MSEQHRPLQCCCLYVSEHSGSLVKAIRLKRGSAPTALSIAPIVLTTASGNFAKRQVHNEAHMNKLDGYNSPKGAANNAAQKPAPAKSPVTKQANQPAAKPAAPSTSKSTEKGKK